MSLFIWLNLPVAAMGIVGLVLGIRAEVRERPADLKNKRLRRERLATVKAQAGQPVMLTPEHPEARHDAACTVSPLSGGSK